MLRPGRGALGEDLRVALGAQLVADLPQGVEQARGEAELQRALLLPRLLVEDYLRPEMGAGRGGEKEGASPIFCPYRAVNKALSNFRFLPDMGGFCQT